MLCKDTKQTFLCGARMLFGSWLLYLGVMKWIGGASGFVGYISSTFEKTWVPAPMLLGMGWLILVAEVVCGLWILSGIKPRLAWVATTLLMFALTFGQTLIAKYDVVANNWQYVILCLLCASLSEPLGKKEGG